jgi:hypothetical protein
VNDADRLPAMRWIVGGHAVTKQAASTSSIQVARQDRCRLHRSKWSLTVRNGHGAEFLIAKSARSSAPNGLSCQCRAGFAAITHLCQRTLRLDGVFWEMSA